VICIYIVFLDKITILSGPFRGLGIHLDLSPISSPRQYDLHLKHPKTRRYIRYALRVTDKKPQLKKMKRNITLGKERITEAISWFFCYQILKMKHQTPKPNMR